jgi:hypothetical protein
MYSGGEQLVNKRILVTVSFGILVTLVVFYGLQDSQNRLSLSRIPITPDNAIEKVVSSYNISKDRFDKTPHFVYVKPDGSVYKSDPEQNNIGKIIGHTDITKTGGSHFAWEINDLQGKEKYYVDAIVAEIISNSSYN